MTVTQLSIRFRSPDQVTQFTGKATELDVKQRSEDRSSRVSLLLGSHGSDGISLQLASPCCSSMAQNFAPYH